MNARRSMGGGRKLTVLYSFPHALGAPGIGWTAWNQVNELVRAGHEVHVVVASVAKPVEGAASLRTTMTVFSRRVPHRAVGRDRALRYHDYVASRRVRKANVAVVHAWPLASELTFKAAARRGIPTLREVPNTHTAHAYEVVARESARLGLEPRRGASHTHDARHLAAEEREWAAATALLIPSEAVAQTFRDRGFDPGRLLRHQYGSNARPTGHVREEGPFTAVFVGRGEPRKGLHYALEAWIASDACRTGRFLVFGALEPKYARYLAPMLAHKSVEVHGVTDDPMGVLSQADVMLLPTIEEGSALVTYEAQVAGCVPLVSIAAGAVIEHGITGFTHEVGDVGTLTRQLDTLCTRPELLEAMRAAAISRAESLTWTAAVRRQVDAYRAAVALADKSRRVSA
ncbi:glycosyltransferase family 4 protein [Micromonospora sp. DT81.3]|uniref:glycosyltransferase family 4 protein n=1 Tax=Micromonospora sp. DT81.3 TaxID=3416523 RepID=UPI003CE73510